MFLVCFYIFMDVVFFGFLLFFDFFKGGGGWLIKYIMVFDLFEIIKYGNLSFKLLMDLGKKYKF